MASTQTHTPRIRLGDMLRVARKDAGLEQGDVADALGVSRPTISKWENSKSQPPFWAVVEWAMLTNVDVEFFVSARPSDQQKRPTIWEATNPEDPAIPEGFAPAA